MTPEPPPIRRATVGAEDVGARLDKWLSATLALTRTRARALIEAGSVTRDGVAVQDPASKLRAGDVFAVDLPAVAPYEVEPESVALSVLYEDDALIVVDKPAGMVVHPAAGHARGTLVNALLAHCGPSLSGVGGVARPGVVHRIDKDTSGLVVVAKTDAAHQGLAVQFAAHEIERVYEAIALGAPRPGVGTIDKPMARSKTDRTRMAVVRDVAADDETSDDDVVLPSGARRAVTHYRIVESFGRARARLPGDSLASRIECRLETGRTHQIRVHMASIGHPILGDPVYGRGPGLSGLRSGDAAADAALEVFRAFRRQALHARVLGFVHPVTGDVLRFEAPPPADFAGLVAAFKAL
ncbi:MAG: RluA family pseudouridine synthase [Parvularculaceae bacterium]|nr:RluA family pseudouridine synthase [Parvularculaceae bacterium]